MGTGGAGQSTGGFPQSTPSTTTPRQSSTGISGQEHQTDIPAVPSTEQGIPNTVTSPKEEGTGGSGMDEKNRDANPDACNKNQIGSPNSMDVICDEPSSSSSSTSAEPITPDENSGMGGSGVDPGTTDDTKMKEKPKDQPLPDTNQHTDPFR